LAAQPPHDVHSVSLNGDKLGDELLGDALPVVSLAMRSAYFIVAVWGAAKPVNKVSPRISTLENVPSTALAATRAPAGPSISHNNAGFSPCQRTANEIKCSADATSR
jgi:hypothetical protein